MTYSSEYKAYYSMLTRCCNEKSPAYRFYGARGIKICKRWMIKFSNFYQDMGNKPSPLHSIDRIDNDGDYSKENCRWALPQVQSVNTRRAYKLKGEKVSINKISKDLGVPRGRIHQRVRRGMSIENAIKNPHKKYDPRFYVKKVREKTPKIPKKSGFPGVSFDKRGLKNWFVRPRMRTSKAIYFNDLKEAINYAKSIGWKL